jgi:hypothetical protein
LAAADAVLAKRSIMSAYRMAELNPIERFAWK